MRVASIQLEIKDSESKEQRIERVSQIMAGLKEYDLVLLPEIWSTGYFSFPNYKQEAETLEGPLIQKLAKQAKSLGILLFAGSFVEEKDRHYYNTSVFIGRNGEIQGVYRKIHLFRYGSKEGEILTPGNETTVLQTEFGKVGLSTCFDLRFPELYRKQIDDGAEILLVTSAWPYARVEHWNLFNRTRALENQCFLISCNCVGETSGVTLAGHSQVVNPWGEVVASAKKEETILKADIDTESIAKIRGDFPQLKLRML